MVKTIKFKDYPEFTPNLTPREMFKLGSFGGTYWRPIYCQLNKQKYKNEHLKYPKSWWKNIPDNFLTEPEYNVKLNKYNVKVGTSLEFWTKKNWINKQHPYGWVHWYCDFYRGKRSDDDERQIKRWSGLTGPNGRFRKWLVTLIRKKDGEFDDFQISPKIRQTLQHWGYQLTKTDFDADNKERF
tara:strand:+ start:780 stop:1331 length:552 start_codon:yes stop_codon:yes gene_type:complete